MKKENNQNNILNFGDSVINLPGRVMSALPNASADDLKILIAVASNPAGTPEEISAAAGIGNPAAYDTAIAFWRGAGLFGAQSAPISKAVAKKAEEAVTSIPTYSVDEIADIVSSNVAIAGMIDECTEILGTVNQTTNMKLVAAVEYFNIEPEYLVTVTAYCARIGKKSLGYVLSTVSSLCKAGIDSVDLLNDYLLGIEKTAKYEPQIRQLIGTSMTRELTAKEKEYFSTWSNVYKYEIDVIRMAYEITVDSIGEPSLAYMNAILQKWNSEGLKTEDEIKDFIKKTAKSKKTDAGKSFDDNDFFSAALKKAYAEAGTIPDVKNQENSDRNYSPKPMKKSK